MTSSELAREALPQSIKRRFRRVFGPWAIFFEGFVKHPVMVGSIIPSSRFTVDRMLDPVDWDNCKLFVEYGPGVGTFCRPILDRLRRDGALIVIDTNPLFIDYLKRTSTALNLLSVMEIVRAHGHEHADYVVSGLPFSTLPDGVGPEIAAATHRVIRPGGAFLVYQFSAKARDFMARHFKRIDEAIEVRNIPPCRLYWGWKE